MPQLHSSVVSPPPPRSPYLRPHPRPHQLARMAPSSEDGFDGSDWMSSRPVRAPSSHSKPVSVSSCSKRQAPDSTHAVVGNLGYISGYSSIPASSDQDISDCSSASLQSSETNAGASPLTPERRCLSRKPPVSGILQSTVL